MCVASVTIIKELVSGCIVMLIIIKPVLITRILIMVHDADHPRHLKEMAYALHKIATIHQATSMLGTSKMSYFQVITTGPQAVIKVSGHQYRWLVGWL